MTTRALALAAQPADEPTVLLTPDQAAARLHMPRHGVLRLARQQRIGCVRYAHRVLFTEAHVEAFIAEHAEDAAR